MKTWKRILCVFLAVVLLFFGVNNSYFSPHKMDTVEASSIVVGGAVITIDFVIKIIAALAVAGLGVGIIVEWSDVDLEAVLEDFHAWLKENTAILDSLNIDGTSALKEWAVSDSWYVIEGGASGGSDPSPSPDTEPDINKHGAGKIWPAGTTWTIGNMIAAGGILAEQAYNQEVSSDEDVNKVVNAYMQSKINTFSTDSAGSDPVTQVLKSRYVGDGLPHYYGSFDIIDGYIQVNASSQSMDAARNIIKYEINAPCGYRTERLAYLLSNDNLYLYRPYGTNSFGAVNILQTVTYYRSDGSLIRTLTQSSHTIACNNGYSTNIPIFTDETAMINYLHGLTDDSACINRERQHNYIDTDDDYGWASTAGITPADLAASMPDLLSKINGKNLSLSAIMLAINALKNKLEEENPNTGTTTDPITYPTSTEYIKAVDDIVNDPTIFPEVDDVVDPAPNPGTGTDTDEDVDPGEDVETSKDYSGLLGLIIGLLESILQAIKDFMSWFIIDFAAIKAHILLALDSVPSLTGYEDFLAIVDSAKGQITNSYEYPVITIECPEILRPYWKQEQIILLDFEDYATYFIWVRTAMAFAILFGFAVWCVRDIKVAFTLN